MARVCPGSAYQATGAIHALITTQRWCGVTGSVIIASLVGTAKPGLRVDLRGSPWLSICRLRWLGGQVHRPRRVGSSEPPPHGTAERPLLPKGRRVSIHPWPVGILRPGKWCRKVYHSCSIGCPLEQGRCRFRTLTLLKLTGHRDMLYL